MTRILFFLLIIISFNGFSSQDNQEKQEGISIFNKLADQEITEKEFLRELEPVDS